MPIASGARIVSDGRAPLLLSALLLLTWSAAGAAVYALHCPEMAPFLGTWYLLGMLIPALLGAVSGPRLLRW